MFVITFLRRDFVMKIGYFVGLVIMSVFGLIGKMVATEMPKEIEIKIKGTDEVFEKLNGWLLVADESRIKASPKKLYIDTYLDSQKNNFYEKKNELEFVDVTEFLRYREKGNAASLCYKYRKIDLETKKTVAVEELECPVDDFFDTLGEEKLHKVFEIFDVLGLNTKYTKLVAKKSSKLMNKPTFLDLLKNLEFTTKCVLKKHRTTYLVDDTFEIAVDEFTDGNGVLSNMKFVEVELKKKVPNVQTGIKQITLFLKKELGLEKITTYDRGYVCMALNPNYNFEKSESL